MKVYRVVLEQNMCKSYLPEVFSTFGLAERYLIDYVKCGNEFREDFDETSIKSGHYNSNTEVAYFVREQIIDDVSQDLSPQKRYRATIELVGPNNNIVITKQIIFSNNYTICSLPNIVSTVSSISFEDAMEKGFKILLEKTNNLKDKLEGMSS